jgi:predicted RNA-binding Zn-ribbon protein involved in translation (DUF1610 family)
MPEGSPRRVHLIDLVMAVILCGLIVAMFTSSAGLRQSNVTMLAAGAVGAVWAYLRYLRSAPACAECGARFFPAKGTDPGVHCPHCGEPQAPIRQPIVPRIVILCIIAVLLAISVMGAIASAVGTSHLASLAIAVASAFLCILAIVWFFKTPRRSAHPPIDRVCEGCGNAIPGELPTPSVCPNCRARSLTHEQLKKEQAKGSRFIVLVLAVIAIVAIYWLVSFTRSMFESGNWTGLILIAPLLIVGSYFSWKLIRLLIRSRRLTGFLDETAFLAQARACAGEEGTIVKDGSTTIWYSGPDDPVPMLRQENAAVNRRFTAMIGEREIPDRPLRVLCFHDRDALARLFKALFPYLDFSAQLGVYLQRPWNVMTLCTGSVAGRLDDPHMLAGSLYCTILVERVFGQLSAPWLHVGITRAFAANRSHSDLVALNRRMLAGRSQEIEYSHELFTMSANKVSKLLLTTKDFQTARRSDQFLDQAWSIIEFLAGGQAPESRKAAFRAFVQDKPASRRHEETFFQHFGFGFGSLLDSWREWVTEQGRGPDEPPAPELRDALNHRVLPVIRDRAAPIRDRIQAIRDWGRAGVPLGADALIDLLRDPGDLPRDELVWSLCRASGLPWDDDPQRWQAWCDERCTQLQTM